MPGHLRRWDATALRAGRNRTVPRCSHALRGRRTPNCWCCVRRWRCCGGITPGAAGAVGGVCRQRRQVRSVGLGRRPRVVGSTSNSARRTVAAVTPRSAQGPVPGPVLSVIRTACPMPHAGQPGCPRMTLTVLSATRSGRPGVTHVTGLLPVLPSPPLGSDQGPKSLRDAAPGRFTSAVFVAEEAWRPVPSRSGEASRPASPRCADHRLGGLLRAAPDRPGSGGACHAVAGPRWRAGLRVRATHSGGGSDQIQGNKGQGQGHVHH